MKAKRLYQNKVNSQFNLFIRSLILSLIMTVTCIFYCFVCLLAAPFPLSIRWRVTSLWIRGMIYLCKTICHIDYRVEGLRNVMKIKNGILMSKHQSAWETFFIQGNFDQVAMIVKRELLWFPFFGWALALLGPIAINRSDRKSAMQQIIQQGGRYLEAGRWVCVFPEGTRIAAGEVGKYKIGGARLAVATGYPIIPVAHNAGRFWPRRQFIKKPGIIRIDFGPPIDPQGKTAEEVLELTKNWIEEKVAELDQP
jgi:1-acyl-sn-glycerol-3-phosphate acyltransferase